MTGLTLHHRCFVFKSNENIQSTYAALASGSVFKTSSKSSKC